MNLHLSGCTLGGGETRRRSVPRFFFFFFSREGELCVFLNMSFAHTHIRGTEAIVVAGLIPPSPHTHTHTHTHINLYFMMSRCSMEAGHGTCRKEHEVGSECVWEGRVNAKGLGQEQLHDAIWHSLLGPREPDRGGTHERGEASVDECSHTWTHGWLFPRSLK